MRVAPPPASKRPTPPLAAENVGAGEPHQRQPNVGGVGHRKKGASVRTWLVIDATGQSEAVEIGKHAVMRRTGLPARDLRLLDPVLSYPSNILGRERAIVVNLEHIKAIITAQEVLFLNSTDPLVAPFVKKLQGIFRHRQAVKTSQETGVDVKNEEWSNLYNLGEPLPTEVSSPHPPNYNGGFPNKDREENEDRKQQNAENPHSLRILPFEFVALEACLEAACSCLDNEARTLEQETHPALDKLTSKISTLNLERVRQIKSRLVAITGRVQKVRDELEHLLDDDEDMAEMYLTEKLEQQQLENSSVVSSKNDEDGILGISEEASLPDTENRINGQNLMEGNEKSVVTEEIEQIDEQKELIYGEPLNALKRDRDSRRTQTSVYSTVSKHLDVEELEMILEAYFVQIDGTLNNLSNLREYVDDTEDYINIMLDDKQNHLLQMGVMLTTATVVVSAFVAMTGVFGMNITIELFDEKKAGNPEFLWTTGGGTAACVFLYVVAIAWCKYKQLLE